MTHTVYMRSYDLQPETGTIWRYVSFWKLESLLRRNQESFTRLRYMAAVEDRREGALSPVNYSHPEIEVEYFLNEVLAPGNPPEITQAHRRQFADPNELKRYEDWTKDHSYVNSWIESDHESWYMWENHCKEGDGVVMKSRIGRLKRAFDTMPGEQLIQRCVYIDTNHETVQLDVCRAPIYKDASFREHEQEVRAFVVNQEHNYPERSENGIFVPILPRILIEEIRTSPRADVGLMGRVQTLVRQVGLNVPIIPSELTPETPNSK